MIDGEPIIGHKIASGYHGTEAQPQYRGVEACQNLWNKEIKVGSFDDLIFNQLENAKKQGRKKVTILDIGSGQGNLFRDFLSQDKLGSKSREFLSQNRDFNIEMVGITDAKTVDELLTEEEITAKGENTLPNNSQIKAKNIKYTLSFNQRIKDVLESQKIEGIDLCVSTVALTYLGPSVFENTLTDVVNNLHQGGQMVAYDYSGIAPGIIQPDPMFLSLDVRDVKDIRTSASLKAVLNEHSMRFARRGVNLQDEENALEKAEDLMVRLGVRTKEEIEKRRKEFLADPDVNEDRGMALGRRATYLSGDERDLMTKHITKLREVKKQQLTSLFEIYNDQIKGEFKEGTISFSKK